MTLSMTAGIDVGQKYLDVGFSRECKPFRSANDPEGIADIIRRLASAGIQRVAMEAIGPYAQRLIQALGLAGFDVGVINPQRIRAFRQAEGCHAKTDRLDAGLIARFAEKMETHFYPAPDSEAVALKSLAARRSQLIEMIAVEKKRLKQAMEPFIVASLQQAIHLLSRDCKAVEAELMQRIAADPVRTRILELLVSIPGIGTRIASILVTDMPELGQRDRKAIASLAGLAPHISQSGNAPPRASISGGRPCVRAALYMAALVAIRHDPQHKEAYRRLKAAGKPSKVAIIAVARKMLTIANAIIKDGRTYKNHNMPA
jgi:transposase